MGADGLLSVNTVELLLFGFAAVVDLALLFALWERVNRGRVAIWLTGLVTSVTLIHVGIFLRLMLVDLDSQMSVTIDRLLVMCICLGLLVLPSAMLHAAIRLNHTGLDPYAPKDPRYARLYAPVLLLPVIMFTVWQSAATNFISHVGVWRVVYLIWLALVNSVSVYLFLRLRGERWAVRRDSFLIHFSIAIVVISVLAIVYGTIGFRTQYETPLRLLATLSPLGAALLFVWHSMRERLLPLVMERTFVYGVILISLLLTQRLIITPIAGWLRSKTGIDFFFVEGILITMVILLVPSLRARVAEALRNLFSTNVTQVRNATRQVALKLSQNASLDTKELVRWFADEVRHSIALDHVTIVMDDEVKANDPWVVKSVEPLPHATECCLTDDMALIHRQMTDTQRVLELGNARDKSVRNLLPGFGPEVASHKWYCRPFYNPILGTGAVDTVERAFVRENVLLAYRLSYRSVTGTVMLGNRVRNDRLASEQILVLALVIDQFVAALHNRREETLRQRAERKMLQQEKLSVLGLLAGSLAHELRNPLSSIRTITTLVMEELGEDHECQRDLRMVLSEIDRLSLTTNRLLDYARPEPQSCSNVVPDQLISRIVCILDYLARQYHVETKLKLQCGGAFIASNEAGLSEIIFNLVKNAIEATRETDGGRVEIVSKCEDGQIVVSVCDNGGGIADERKANLFQPFATYKADGNGLGLYAVHERVRELGGSVSFRPNEPCGTVFEVRIPIAGQDDHFGG